MGKRNEATACQTQPRSVGGGRTDNVGDGGGGGGFCGGGEKGSNFPGNKYGDGDGDELTYEKEEKERELIRPLVVVVARGTREISPPSFFRRFLRSLSPPFLLFFQGKQSLSCRLAWLNLPPFHLECSFSPPLPSLNGIGNWKNSCCCEAEKRGKEVQERGL